MHVVLIAIETGPQGLRPDNGCMYPPDTPAVLPGLDVFAALEGVTDMAMKRHRSTNSLTKHWSANIEDKGCGWRTGRSAGDSLLGRDQWGIIEYIVAQESAGRPGRNSTDWTMSTAGKGI